MANVITSGSVLLKDPLAYFPNFLWKTWNTLLGVNPTPLLYDFAEYLDGGYLEQLKDAAAGGDLQAQKILMAFRGAAKSWVTTTYAVCCLRRDRTEQVLCVSATGKFAGGIATFAYNMVRNFDWLADMKPRSDQRQSALAFDVNGAPVQKDESFASEGLFGQITGRRATRIIGDDLEVPNTSETESARARLKHRMGEFSAIIKPGKGGVYLLGTAQTEDTIYKHYADELGYELRIYPVQFPRITDPLNDERKKYGSRLAPYIRKQVEENPALGGTSTEPTRFTEADLLQRRKVWGATEYGRQFLMYLDAGSGKGNPLKLRDLVVLELAPPSHSVPQVRLPAELQWAPSPAQQVPDIQVDSLSGDSALFYPMGVDVWLDAEEVVMFIDTSGSGTDETCWTVAAGLLGRVAICDQGYSTDGSSADVLRAIAATGKKWKVGRVIVEANFGGEMFGQLLIPMFAELGHPVTVETIPAGATMKEKRIVDTLEPVQTDHRLIVNAEVFRKDYQVDYEDVEERDRRFYRLTYQMSRMVKVKGAVRHDDRVDSMAGAVRYFADVLLRQVREKSEEGRMKALDKEIEDIIEVRKRLGLPLYGMDKPASTLGRPTSRNRIGTPSRSYAR